MTNEQEIERISKLLSTTKHLEDASYVNFDEMAKELVNTGIGDKKKAVKEFAKRIVSACEVEAVYAEWKDEHGEEFGGDMVSVGVIEAVIDELLTKLYGI